MSPRTESPAETKSSIAIRPYRPADREALLAMLERVYDPDTRKRYEILWDWWQEWPCRSADPHLHPAVVERGGRVAGFSGMQSRRFKIGSEERSGAFNHDNFTEPSQRGVGLPLVRHLLAVTDLIIGAPVSRNNKLWTILIGREQIDVFRLRKAKRVIDPEALLRKGRFAVLAGPARLLWSAASAFLAAAAPRLRNAEITEVDRFPPETDLLCRRWLDTQTNTAHRDAEWLNWRFAEGPLAYRKVLLRQGGQLAGLAAFRLGWMNGRRVLILVEILAAHAEPAKAYGSLIGYALNVGRRAGASDAQTLDAGCPHLRLALRRWGFVFRDEALPVIGKLGEDRSDACPLYRTQDWFISAADNDFEFTCFNQGWRELTAPEAAAP